MGSIFDGIQRPLKVKCFTKYVICKPLGLINYRFFGLGKIKEFFINVSDYLFLTLAFNTAPIISISLVFYW